MSNQNPSGKPIQSLQRAIDILNCFDEEHHLLSMQEISKMTELNINTARGLVGTLLSNNLLRQSSATGKYSLGYYLVIKGEQARHQEEEILNFCKPSMLRIADKYRVTCSLQIANRKDIFTIYCAHASNAAYRIYTSQYVNLPLSATSSGKLLLYYNILEENLDNLEFMDIGPLTEFTPYTITDKTVLKQIMQNIALESCAVESEEYEIGLGSLAVPILDSTNHLIATISVSSFINSFHDHYESLLQDLRSIAERLNQHLKQEYQVGRE